MIVGAGVGGLCAALGLQRAGWQVTVWERWPDFVASARLLEQEAEKLAAAARSGSDPALAAQLQSVTRTCTACHDRFRVRQ